MAGELGGVFPEVCFLESNCYSHTLHTDSTGGRGLEIASFQVLEDGAFFIKCEFTMFRCCSQRLGVNLEDTAPPTPSLCRVFLDVGGSLPWLRLKFLTLCSVFFLVWDSK